MKTINIQKRRSAQNPFEVCMGNGARIQFTSKRNAAQFMAETNRFLTKILVILNASLIDNLREYRLIWLVATNTDKGTRTAYFELERKIKDNLQAAEEVLDKFGATWSNSNDPYFSFIDLRKSANFQATAAQLMADFHKKRNHTAGHYTCQAVAERCLGAIAKLEKYPN